MDLPSMMTYEEFLLKLYGQNQFAIKLGLDSIRSAFAEAGHPERCARAIIIAGTNGKGTTSAYLAGILQAHGLKVGLYTSPHLTDLRERFRIEGRPVSRELTLEIGVEVLERYGQPFADRGGLTFFELTTLMATLIFSRVGVDVAIYEVGLGGRLDAVNGIEPALSVITTIDFDHQQYLGDTIEAITREKYGIFRASVPGIIGFQTRREVLEVCRESGPKELEVYGESFDASNLGEALEAMPRIVGINASTAWASARSFLGEDFDPCRGREGLARVRWPGRLDLRELSMPGHGRRRFLFDAAHNPAGVSVLREFIDSQDVPIGAVVCGAMKDKNLEPMFAWLREREWPVCACLVDNPRSASEEELRKVLKDANLEHVSDCQQSMDRALTLCGPEEIVLVFGSIYLLGECLALGGLGADELLTYMP